MSWVTHPGRGPSFPLVRTTGTLGNPSEDLPFLHNWSEGLVVPVGVENTYFVPWPWCGKELQMAWKVSCMCVLVGLLPFIKWPKKVVSSLPSDHGCSQQL